MNNSMHIPGHDLHLQPPEMDDALTRAIESIDDETMGELEQQVADDWAGGTTAREALGDVIRDLADAHYILELLFKYPVTIEQAINMTLTNTHHIQALRQLRDLTEQASKDLRTAIDSKGLEILDEAKLQAEQDAADATDPDLI